MGKSFFLGTDAEMYTGSAAFSTQIGAQPTSFGLSSIQASSYATLNSAYASAYLAANNPDTRTKGAVAAKNTAKANLRVSASNLASIIDGTPTVTDQQKIDLGISVRATPSPMPDPGTPEALEVTLDGAGGLILKWKCANPTGSQGTMYQIYRRVTASGEFTYLGGSGEKKFTDSTVPAGSSQVTYKIQAVRSTAVGLWAQFNVLFGVSGSGEMIASVAQTSPRIAA
jgi:hypothetical protein